LSGSVHSSLERLNAIFLSQARREGKPTANPAALDIDVLIAAQALSFAATRSEVTIATTNVKHLSQYTRVRHWSDIAP
jgi:hypothetical protein